MPYALCPMPYALCPMPYALCPMPYALCPMPYALCPMPYALCPMPYALCPMPYALCPMPYALCPMPYALCPMPYALCPTVCLNPIAWKVSASEGYRISKPIDTKVTDLLYIDDLKIFAAWDSRLSCVMKSVKTGMEDVGLQWNPKKCVNFKRGTHVADTRSASAISS